MFHSLPKKNADVIINYNELFLILSGEIIAAKLHKKHKITERNFFCLLRLFAAINEF